MARTIGYTDSRIDTLITEFQHNSHIYPNVSNLTCTMTAGATPNVMSAWVEITDSGATTMSSLFATSDGHISGIEVYDCNVADKVYLVDMTYGAAKVGITSFSFSSNAIGKKLIPKLIKVRADHIPAGETVYYRAMCETASKTLLVSFRYHLHT